MNRRLVVMSADALVHEDIEQMRSLPETKEFFERAACVETLRTIYPSITYPAHASMATGTYPARHGVVDNSELHIGMRTEMPWNWFHGAQKAEDLFTVAKRAGLRTAGVFWPVTGNHPDVDYLVAEYWPQSEADTIREAFSRAGSSEEVLRDTVDKYLPGLKIRVHPQTDRFVVNCACDMIRAYKPELLMIHPADVDGARHHTGLFTPEVSQSVADTAGYLRQLIDATKQAGVYEETNFVLMSDHGQLDIKRVLFLNPIFADNGLIEIGEDGSLQRWKAYLKSTRLSAQVYLSEPEDAALRDTVYQLLIRLRDEGLYGISEVFTAEEIYEKECLAGGFSFVVETDGYTAFGDGWQRPIVRSFDLNDYRAGHATHGHLPDKGPQPVFYAMGPSVREGVCLPRRPIVDMAPTMARMLNLDMPNADGKPVLELLR